MSSQEYTPVPNHEVNPRGLESGDGANGTNFERKQPLASHDEDLHGTNEFGYEDNEIVVTYLQPLEKMKSSEEGNEEYYSATQSTNSSGTRLFNHGEHQQMDFEPEYESRDIRKPLDWLKEKLHQKPAVRSILGYSLMVVSFLLAGFIIFRQSSLPITIHQASLKTSAQCKATSNWQGWKGVKYMFAFGDSWTSTAFDPSLYYQQPRPDEPMGNPAFPGYTSSNGTSYIGYMTAKYNQSQILTYNLAVAGTTLDNHITDSFPNPVVGQVYSRFMPYYGEAYSPPWRGNDTLFVMFVGINDVVILNGYPSSRLLTVPSRLLTTHHQLLTTLHGTGARNFLLLTLPPLERTPQPTWTGSDLKAKFHQNSREYSERVKTVAGMLKTDFSADTNVFVFDLMGLFEKALDRPGDFAQLGGIRDTSGLCPAYDLGAPSPDYKDPSCEYAMNEYFWLNGLHPTSPAHDLMADEIVELLESGPNVC